VLRFDAGQVQWDRSGVTGVAMRLEMEQAVHHGVLRSGAGDQCIPSCKTVARRGESRGRLAGRCRVAAISTVRFDAGLTAALTELAGFKSLPAVEFTTR